MLKNKELTYVTLFSSGGVGCYGFKMENFHCIATNELLPKRIEIQKNNNICEYESGYIQGDLSTSEIKNKIYSEIKRWKKRGNDKVDVVIATPPCQGISVINHKKNDTEIKRNSLVVDSIEVINNIKPRFLIFENVMAFQKTLCTTPDNRNIPIGEYIIEALGNDYIISGQIMNLMNHGSNSSRTRTIVIGVNKAYRNYITPYDIFPEYSLEKTLRDVIYDFPRLEWGEIESSDFYHAFRTYAPKMREWIQDLKEGESAFDNIDPEKRPHRVIDGRIVENVRKNRDKYTRQPWDRFIQCIHTRNDQLAAQNTIHPEQDRVYSIRELMSMMTVPHSFKWIDMELSELNELPVEEKRRLYKENELTIRSCLGEAVPTEPFRRIAHNIKSTLLNKYSQPNDLNKIIAEYELDSNENLKRFLNTSKLDLASLMRITELCNSKREENAAFYTNKFIVNEIMGYLPSLNKDEIRILEPSVGAGNFLPFIIKRYKESKKVVIDIVDIDQDSIENLKILLKRIDIPKNITINIICADFLLLKLKYRYDLVIGNPPFSKITGNPNLKEKYLENNLNKNTSNLSVMFLEKCLKVSDCTALILNKTVLSNGEFEQTRNLVRNTNIKAILDFGRKGFTGVSIETICLLVNPLKKPKNTIVYSMKFNRTILQTQDYITDPTFPVFLIYRNQHFDNVAKKMEFGIFDVFRDRQITKSLTTKEKNGNSLWVIKAKNINDDGQGVSQINEYDQYISERKAKSLASYRFVNNTSVYLTPNMTYNPRVVKNIPDTIADGSTAVLIPKSNDVLSKEQLDYFSTEEYRSFYQIARNLSTQSINVDKTSVYFYGKLIK